MEKELTKNESEYLDRLKQLSEAFYAMHKIVRSYSDIFESGVACKIGDVETNHRPYIISVDKLSMIGLMINETLAALTQNSAEFRFDEGASDRVIGELLKARALDKKEQIEMDGKPDELNNLDKLNEHDLMLVMVHSDNKEVATRSRDLLRHKVRTVHSRESRIAEKLGSKELKDIAFAKYKLKHDYIAMESRRKVLLKKHNKEEVLHMTEAPVKGSSYWIIPNEEEPWYYEIEWKGDDVAMRQLSDKRAFATRELRDRALALIRGGCQACGGSGHTDGWVPTYNDPDNAGMHKEAEPCPECYQARKEGKL